MNLHTAKSIHQLGLTVTIAAAVVLPRFSTSFTVGGVALGLALAGAGWLGMLVAVPQGTQGSRAVG